jgi:hypothetical protein
VYLRRASIFVSFVFVQEKSPDKWHDKLLVQASYFSVFRFTQMLVHSLLFCFQSTHHNTQQALVPLLLSFALVGTFLASPASMSWGLVLEGAGVSRCTACHTVLHVDERGVDRTSLLWSW